MTCNNNNQQISYGKQLGSVDSTLTKQHDYRPIQISTACSKLQVSNFFISFNSVSSQIRSHKYFFFELVKICKIHAMASVKT